MMNKEYMDILPEIREAIESNKPVVALESTILSHGMPYPENVDFAAEVEKVVRAEGAVPATTALIGGRIKVGLSPAELEVMCRAEDVGKVSRRDMATYLAMKKTGATTVATTMICAEMAGVKVFATGGIGGVHRHGEVTMDISADLQELKQTSVAVVCAGAKQILDIGRTLEYLETMGVPVIGNGTADFPAFYCRKSGYGVDYAAKDETEIAGIIKTKWDLGLAGGVLIGNPIPEEYALDFEHMERVINQAQAEADAAGVHGKNITPFLLAKIKELTKGVSFASNVQLAYNNARVAAKISKALCGLSA
jgi:pseudouridine-5'-phosphate glycosidase